VRIRIYTVSGELVRVIDEGDKTGGFTYYTTWDGKNMSGAHVASGVYFAVFDVPGKKPKEHVVKMVVLR
jgi:flagellar hook assembly protein FlgD